MGDMTIFRNPACATSRNVLAMTRNSGVEPTNMNSLEMPPGRAELVELVAAMGITVRALPFAKEDGEQVIDGEDRRAAR